MVYELAVNIHNKYQTLNQTSAWLQGEGPSKFQDYDNVLAGQAESTPRRIGGTSM
jgi:hypothetical protein